MKLTFRIHYNTLWGENLCVLFDDDRKVIPLSTRDGNLWAVTCEYEMPESVSPLHYRYAVYRNGTCIRKELGGIPHLFYRGNAQQSHCILDDCWRDLPADAPLYSEAFNGGCTPARVRPLADGVGSSVTFRALCPGLDARRQVLGVIGSCDALGNWEYCRPLRMSESRPGVWHLTLDAEFLKQPFEYKFVAVDATTGSVVEWESRPNRQFVIQPLLRGESYFLPETEVFFALPAQRVAGCAIPVFSLRSEGSFGVGDFGDLKMFIDWAAKTGQHAVQILPINDTTITGEWTDSYPYNSISIYAFHPMFVDLRQLPPLENNWEAELFEQERLKLNALPKVDYEEVNRLKRAYLRSIYEQESRVVENSEDYRRFVDENRDWLLPYAAFGYLRDSFGTADFRRWDDFSRYDAEKINALCAPGGAAHREAGFCFYVQYCLHKQLSEAAAHARNLGILLKGDIPIGISREGVESWAEPRYFNLNGQAGAPPDAFSTNGQNWGFPTYAWDVMEADGYSWWKRRFAHISKYFTAYRIDHILGFFRIWEIPLHSVHGLLGQFVPSLPMSADEIRSFGLPFDAETMTRPFIALYMLNILFGERSEWVRETFMRPLHHDLYAMRPEFDTQRKVEAWFAGKTDEESIDLKEKLYSLISNVLFVADRDNPDRFHPRIGVQNDYTFKRLSPHEQEAFNNLYNHYYYQRHNEFWYKEAMKKLPALTQSTAMLACGEDLGMVPGCVPWVMDELQILSLEVQRMPREMNCEFGRPEQYPYHSVCTTGTHDMSTLRGWWKENPAQSERFYRDVLRHWGEVPEEMPGWLCREVISAHLSSPSLLCILPWQDWLGMDEDLRHPDADDERINVPANPKNYWQWRMHLTLEQLMCADALNEKIRELIEKAGR